VIELVSAAILLGLTLSFMVGPVFLILLETSIYQGALKALVFNFGVLISDILLIALAFYGSEQLLSSVAGNKYVYIVGGCIILFYAAFSFFRKRNIDVRSFTIQSNFSKNFFKGFLINFLNVGVLAYWLTSTIIIGNKYAFQNTYMWLYFGLTLGTYFTVDIVKILFARKMRQYLTERHLKRLNGIVSFVLGVFGTILVGKGLLLK
jgi:threonine/homoserine/homoserine lactone efflux protein